MNDTPNNFPYNSVPTPIDWSSVTQLPPVTDTMQQPSCICTEGMDVTANLSTRSYETFEKHGSDD